MFPFWETVIAPVIRAAGANRIVEIGALRGETTTLVVDALGPDAELHVIDPLPEFDPSEHERRFPGRYVFHRNLSLNVLGDIGAFDVALIDGDHNWYTVYNELHTLARTAQAADQPLPVLILHDVCWPYGRRDLYYEPSQIPEEFRQPYERKGMRPGVKRLLPGGGMNVTLDNAVMEGGERNGVMTALDDFMKEYGRPLRRVVIPIYFGLAIVVDHQRLRDRPQLQAKLDEIESLEGKQQLLELSEQIRLDGVVFEHNIGNHRTRVIARSAKRYLDVVKSALLDELSLENEVRIEYLMQCAARGAPPSDPSLRDPMRFLRDPTVRLQQARASGQTHDEKGPTAFFPFTLMGRRRLDELERLLERVREDGIPGDLVECAAGRGGGAVFLRAFLEAYELPTRQVWVADRFDAAFDGPVALSGGDLNQVREAFHRFDLLDDRVHFLQGSPEHTLVDAPIEQVALVRIGPGLGKAAGEVLEQLAARLVPGAVVVVDDDDPACRAAVDEFRSRHGVNAPIEQIDSNAYYWRAEEAQVAKPTVSHAALDRAPLAPPTPVDAIDLSVVVVFYNMRREAQRTLHSLTRAYQRDIDDIDYEVIVVENGSCAEQRLGEEFVRSFGPEFRYVDMGDGAPPSPTYALNRGMRLGRGRAFAFMIDGAHVLTPGVVRFGMAGLRTYAPAVVATQQWYLGPGQQPVAIENGYDEDFEDTLFRQIAWPHDGYRLFEIGNFIGERDWFDGILESNCLFAPRSVLEQVGAFDESFSMPGGGYANLDLWERLGSTPGVTVVTILGEGSFHQVHGGTTTNHGDVDTRRSKVFSYGEHYEQLRGKLLRGPTKPLHYVGALNVTAARRTRSRRMTAVAFNKGRGDGPDGLPASPTPIADELQTAFIEGFWNSLAWRETTWLGQRVARAPTDLVAYQELIERVRPDWIIETGSGNGARGLFFASICELVGNGRVLSIEHAPNVTLPQHPRLVYLSEKSHRPETFAKVRDIVGPSPRALVVLSRQDRGRMVVEFEGYAPLVPVGSYVVMEGTIVNGRPVWPGFGPGPAEATREILANHGEFAADPAMERYGLTFNRGGFLKRVK